MVMQPNFDKIIEEALKSLKCPVCARPFVREELKIKPVFNKQFLVHASCLKDHSPAIVLHLIEDKKTDTKPIGPDEILDIHEALKNFDGNFKEVFAKIDNNNQK